MVPRRWYSGRGDRHRSRRQTHELAGRIAGEGNFVDGNSEQFNHDRHGTGVAGVIAARGNNHEGIVGIAPGVKLVVLKACWQLHAGSDEALCNSFTLAQALIAALNADVQIVNLSISGPADPLLNELIEQGVQRGIIFVGAARVTAGQIAFRFPARVFSRSMRRSTARGCVMHCPLQASIS